jgi:hypothetical protein
VVISSSAERTEGQSVSNDIFFLDTVEGHIYRWSQSHVRGWPLPPQGAVLDGYWLHYMGRLQPGQKMNDLLDRFIRE